MHAHIAQKYGEWWIVYTQHKNSDEYIVIKNFRNFLVPLAGWRIFSEPGRLYTFPEITLDLGESVSLYSGINVSGSFI